MSKAKKPSKTAKLVNPLSKAVEMPRAAKPGYTKSRAAQAMERLIIKVQPATSFDYRFVSSGGDARIFHLERGALEPIGGSAQTVLSFRAGAYPGEAPTQGGFFTSPDSIPMTAEAHIVVEEGASGDSIICRSYGSWEGLSVTLTIYREEPDGSIRRILLEEIHDADEHTFVIP